VVRQLSPNERAALDALLVCEFAGVDQLRQQAGSARAQGEGLIIDLVVDPSLPSADVASRVPVGAPVTDAAGNANGLHLFVEDGRLSALEYWWTADEMPEAFPDNAPCDATADQLQAT
jgi:hypothetical protein